MKEALKAWHLAMMSRCVNWTKATWFKRKVICKQPKWNKSFIELIASYVHPKTGNHFRSHLRAIMALDHCRLIRPGKKSGQFFAFDITFLCKILPTNLGACKPTFYTIYTSHLTWNSSMRHCFYHTVLGQKAVFHNTNCTHSIFRKMEVGVGCELNR